ncbi:MAG: sporulation protein YqfD [Eubacteriales bacterium]
MIFTSLVNLAWGIVTAEVESRGESALNYMLRRDIEYFDLHRTPNGALSFDILTRDRPLLEEFCCECGVKVCFGRERGMPSLLRAAARRPGMIVGALLFAAILQLSTYFIWDIEVTAADSDDGAYVDERAVIKSLGELGCGVGTFIPGYDFFELSNEYVAKNPDTAWISVNVSGTRAEVELRTRLSRPNITATSPPSNLVASRDAYIEYYTVFAGAPVIKPGITVKKGELLVSGVVEGKDGSSRIVRSLGHVYAQTRHVLSVEIPYEFTRTVMTGRSECYKTLNIFGKRIKCYINNEILYENYDKIVSEDRAVLFGFVYLPVTLETETVNERTEETETLTQDAARDEGIARLNRMLADELSGAEIISRSFTAQFGEQSVTITCDAVVFEDIAQETALSIE